MDGHQFDDIIKQISGATSRRNVTRGLIAVVASSLGLVARTDAASVKRKPGEICRKNGDCAAGTTCEPGQFGRSVCTCVGGLTVCGGVCVDTTSDEKNCGTCSTQCGLGATPELAQTCTIDGCCNFYDTCGSHCCFTGDACDESESTCCFHEQICGEVGSETCCPGTEYCVSGECAASGRTCQTDGNCLSGEVCAAGGVCCTPDRMCGSNCCDFGKSGCAGTNGDICANLTPQGGLRKY